MSSSLSADVEQQIGFSLGKVQEARLRSIEQTRMLDGLAPELVRVIENREVRFSDRQGRVLFPRTRLVAGAAVKRFSDSMLATHLTEGNKPSDIPDNPYVKRTKAGGAESLENRLFARLLAHRGTITPAHVLDMALDVCDDNYMLATLTAHNFLKEVTYAVRMKETPFFDDRHPADIDTTTLRELGGKMEGLVSRFQDLRVQDDPRIGDRMGPWYHAFGVLFAGSMLSSTEAHLLADMESLTRLFKLGSRSDLGKENVNSWAGRMATAINKAIGEPHAPSRESDEAASADKVPVAEIVDAGDGMITRSGLDAEAVELQPGYAVMADGGSWKQAYGGWREEPDPPNQPKRLGPFSIQPGKYRAHLTFTPDAPTSGTAGNYNTGMVVTHLYRGVANEAQGRRVASIRTAAHGQPRGEASQEFTIHRPGQIYVVFGMATSRGHAGGYWEHAQSYEGRVELVEPLLRQAAEFGAALQPGDRFQAGRRDASLVFADAMMVVLRAGSEIQMERTADGRPRVVLLKGSGRFSHRGEGAAEIEVVTADGRNVLRPRGTDFIVSEAAVGVVAGEVEVVGEGAPVRVEAAKQLTFRTGAMAEFDALAAGPATAADGIPLELDYWVPEDESYGRKESLFRDNSVAGGWLMADPPERWNPLGRSGLARLTVETPVEGTLRLIVPHGSRLDDHGNTAPRLLHKVTGDFLLGATVAIEGEGQDWAGLQFIARAPGSYAGSLDGQFPRSLAEGPGQHYWLGALALARTSGGVMRLPALNDASQARWPEAGDEPIRILMARIGNLFISYWSRDGENWNVSNLAVVDLPTTIWTGWAFINTPRASTPAVFTLSDVQVMTAPPDTAKSPRWNGYASNGSAESEEDLVRLAVDGGAPGTARAFLGEVLEGDFDVEVGFEAGPWEAEPGSQRRWTLAAVDSSERGLAVGCEITDAGQRYGVVNQTQPQYSAHTAMAYGSAVVSERSGRLRLTRSGDAIKAFYWRGGEWNDYSEISYRNSSKGGFGGPLLLRVEVANGERAATFAPLSVTFSVAPTPQATKGDRPPTASALPTDVVTIPPVRDNRRRRVGIQATSADSVAAEAAGLDEVRGVVVKQVAPGSPAATAGLRAADLIVKLSDFEVKNIEDLQARLHTAQPGSLLALSILRGRQALSLELPVTLGDASASPLGSYSFPGGGYQFDILSGWKLDPAPRREQVTDRRYDYLESVENNYQLFLYRDFQGVTDPMQALEAFRLRTSRHFLQGQSGWLLFDKIPAVFVAGVVGRERLHTLYRLAFVVQGRLYEVNAFTPPTNDPGKLPLVLEVMLGSIRSTAAGMPSAEQIQSLRQRAMEVWSPPLDPSLDFEEGDQQQTQPAGWTKSARDPNKIVEVFKPLKLKPGYVLRAYLFSEDGNANGIVWAMPETAEFPEPKDCPTLEHHLFQAPKPWDALDDVMEAIEGDQSQWSYLAASLLRRELREFGASWHGIQWGTHYILDEDPWKKGPPRQDELDPSRPSNPEREWKWSEPKPNEWAPTVQVEPNQITVTYYTYSGKGTQRIIRHTETYRPGSYRARVQDQEIATGGWGYLF